jgi:hypothetical protein
LTELHIPESNFAMCSLVRHGAPYAKITRTTQVATVPLANLLHQYRPTVVKIDIEAGEYALLETLCALPSHVRVLAIEWHNFDPHRTDGGFLALYRSGHAALIASGFEVIYTEGQLIVQQHSAVLHVYNAVRAIAAS